MLLEENTNCTNYVNIKEVQQAFNNLFSYLVAYSVKAIGFFIYILIYIGVINKHG